jgi:hypothetical protein
MAPVGDMAQRTQSVSGFGTEFHFSGCFVCKTVNYGDTFAGWGQSTLPGRVTMFLWVNKWQRL